MDKINHGNYYEAYNNAEIKYHKGFASLNNVK